MTDTDPPIRPKGPTRYDLLRMHDEDFEAMVGRLVGLEFPEAFKPANTSDGGADMVLPNDDGYERCWQAKHYPKTISWTEAVGRSPPPRRTGSPATTRSASRAS